MAVLESTANVHSASFPFSLPATTRLSGEADLIVPIAFFAFFTSDFGFASAGFWAGAGVVAGVGVAGAGVVVCATASPASPIPNTTAMSSATDLFTFVTPPLQVWVGKELPTGNRTALTKHLF